MNRNPFIRFLLASLFLISAALILSACQPSDGSQSGTTPPDTIETVAPGEVETSEYAVVFPEAELPDYSQYATSTRIKEVLGSSKTLASNSAQCTQSKSYAFSRASFGIDCAEKCACFAA